jgi:predicted membrane GTPase involved in stress response
VKPALTKEQQAAKKAHEMAGYRGVGRGMVGASFGGYGVPTAGYGQYQTPTVLYQTSDPGAAQAYSIGYPAAYSQPAVQASPYGGVPGYEVPPSQSYAAVRYPGKCCLSLSLLQLIILALILAL